MTSEDENDNENGELEIVLDDDDEKEQNNDEKNTSPKQTPKTTKNQKKKGRKGGRKRKRGGRKKKEEEEGEEEEEIEEETGKVYCLCRKKYDGSFMLACDLCNDWFHGKCVNISSDDAEKLAVFVCDICKLKSKGFFFSSFSFLFNLFIMIL